MFPCKRDKSPYTPHGFKDAATDQSRITAWWNRWPDANIGMPTGERSGVFVEDEDRPGASDELGAEQPETLVIRTPRGGRHVYFQHVEGVTNSTGGLPEGIDMRGEGGYVLLPPSTTAEGSYTVEHRAEVAEAPEWLLELIRERPRDRGASSGEARRASVSVDGPTIYEGTRHNTLKSIAGRIFAGDVDQLEADLHAINEARCSPRLSRSEVTTMARWFFGKEPCGAREVEPEVEEVLDLAGGYWYDELLRGGGRGKVRDVYRAMEGRAAKFGRVATVTLNGESRRAVAWTDSRWQLSEVAGTSAMSVSRAIRKLKAMGAAWEDSHAKKQWEARTLFILEPLRKCYTPTRSSPREDIGGYNTSSDPPRPDLLETPIYRYRGHVGNAKGGTQAALEAFGPQTSRELAQRLGLSDPRYLERYHLEPMVDLGLVEEQDGVWSLRGDHRERAEEVRREKYVTTHRRKVWTHSHGRWVCEVEETVVDASEVEREEKTREDNEKQRRRFREYLEQRSREENTAFEDLPQAPPEQLAEARRRFEDRLHRRMRRRRRSGIIEYRGMLEDRETGEVLEEGVA